MGLQSRPRFRPFRGISAGEVRLMPLRALDCLDHVGFAGPDLDAMRAEWRELGFDPTPPQALVAVNAAGDKVDLHQRSAHIMLERGYIELTEVREARGHHLAPWLARGSALCIVAYGSKDLRSWRAQCSEPGMSEVMTASRAIEYGEHHGDARFLWCMRDPARTPAALECVVEHLTPQLVFQPAVQRHRNGARALHDVQIAGDRVVGLSIEVTALVARGQREVELRTAPGCRLHFIEADVP
ncbi:MAG: VOC family protein [Gammaproteobacteria bacterium]